MNDCVILVTDLINGVDLWNLRKDCRPSITELEARNIIEKIIKAVIGLTKNNRNIIHRDLHSRNVMIHFKNIQLPMDCDQSDLEDYYEMKYKGQIRKSAQDLTDKDSFEIKLIDFGFARTFKD